jgi:uncharacterized protein (DUF427 family)
MDVRPQESVRDYPRPPAVEAVTRHVLAKTGGRVIIDSTRPVRVLETSHPPAYYIPPADVALQYLAPSKRTTFCEFKGVAHYYSLAVGGVVQADVAWYYPQPSPGYELIAGYIAFYAWAFTEVTLDGEPVTPQPGRFYGGWITSEIRGPFKAIPGAY